MTGFFEAILIGLGIGYLFGSFPTGYFVGRLHGVDVRRHGSGRTGGSNVLRTVGWFGFALTIIGDALKGVIPVLLITHLIAPGSAAAAPAAVLGALLGCNWSVVILWLGRHKRNSEQPTSAYQSAKEFFTRAKGGAGVITTASAALTLFWPPIVLLAVIGIVMLIGFRYSSLASITVAVLYPVLMAYFVITGAAPITYLLMSLITSVIVIYVLIPNIKRLKAGTEQRFGERVRRDHKS